MRARRARARRGCCVPHSSAPPRQAALLTFIGWFIFSIYVGIGFIALPMDSIYAFKNRPKMLSVSEAVRVARCAQTV